MKKTGNQRKVAFGMAVLLMVLQIVSSTDLWTTDKVKAASSPQDTSGIVVTESTSGAAFNVDPTLAMSAVTATEITKNSVTYQWQAVPNATSYYVYKYDVPTGVYQYYSVTSGTSIQLSGLPAGEEVYLALCAVNEPALIRSDFVVTASVYTKPEKVETFTISDNTTTSVVLRWTDIISATGYIIYRAGTGGNFKKIGTADVGEYKDTTLEAGKTYQYKIVAYAGTEENVGEESPAIFTSSLPKAPTVVSKGGNQRVRLTWGAIKGAMGYKVYTEQDGQFVLLTTLEGKSNKKFIHTNLENDQSYKYYVTSYRTYNEVVYESAASAEKTVITMEVSATSTSPKLYKTKTAFKKSNACRKNKEFTKKLDYARSFPIPGMLNTNVAEFGCGTMIPQGIVVAKSYFFVTAYDSQKVENSVVYVLNKDDKELVTTIILPNKTHAGGITFDGKNLWVTQEKTLRSIPFTAIEEAIDNEDPYIEMSAYGVEITLPQQAATVTYYKKLLWVASYDELKPGYLVSYKIAKKGTKPELTPVKTISMPTRVQGIAFSNNGRLIVSRSCQTDPKQRGYMHQLDIYKPNLKKASKGIISLGKVRNTVAVPTMNEEIAVSGNRLYIVFESVSFYTAEQRVDRVCALPVSYVTKLKNK